MMLVCTGPADGVQEALEPLSAELVITVREVAPEQAHAPVGAPYISPAVAWDAARTSLGYEVVLAVVLVTALGLIVSRVVPQPRPATRPKR